MLYSFPDSLTDPALCMDSYARILHANSSFVALLQCSHATVSGNNLYELLANLPALSALITTLKEKVETALQSGRNSFFRPSEQSIGTGISIITDTDPTGKVIALCVILHARTADTLTTPRCNLPDHQTIEPGDPPYTAIGEIMSLEGNSGKSLKISETAFCRVFREQAQVMLIIDAETYAILEANSAATRFYGLSSGELTSLRLDQLSVNPSNAPLAELSGNSNLGILTCTDQQRTSDGSIHDVEISASLVRIEDYLVLSCIICDITERLRMEKDLQLSRSRLDFALKKSHIGWWSMRLDDNHSASALEKAEIFGNYSRIQEWNYSRFLDQVVPEDRPEVDGIIRKALNNQGEWRFECRVSRPNGKERWVLIIGGFQHDDAGNKHLVSGIIMDISERKQAELELEKYRARLDLGLKAARAGVWEWELKNDLHIWSDELLNLYGIDKQRLPFTFSNWADIIHPDDRKATLHALDHALLRETEINIEYRVCHPDGSLHWLMGRGQPVRDKNGKLVRYLGTDIDITEKRQLLESVQQSEADYRSLFENIPSGFAYCRMIDDVDKGKDFVFLNVNERFETLTHLSDVIGKKVTTLIPGIRRSDSALFRIFEGIARNGKTEHFEYYFKALGEWFSVSAYCTRDYSFIVLFDVITKRKQIEKSLRESEHKFRTITEQISEIVFVTDLSGVISYISPSIEKIAGYRQDEVMGHSFFEFLAESEIEKAQKKIDDALSDNRSSEIFELIYRNKSGADIHGEISVRYYREASSNEFSGLIGVIRDITQRKKDEATKKQLELQLQRAERHETIGRLAGGIAHEFNNLLSPILGYAELGMVNAAEEGVSSEYYSAIMQAADRAKHLTAQVLTFSKVHESAPTVVRIQSIITEALKLLRPSIPANIRIEEHIDQKCHNILIDPSRLHQVIVNLCTNAYQAINKSSGLITLELAEMVPDEALLEKQPTLKPIPYARLSITDNGIGMDETTMEHIFEPFFTTKGNEKGCGLGLSVVNSIITSYDGAICVESIPGTLTTFHLYLPVIDKKIDQKQWKPVQAKGSGSILCIDDEQVILNMLSTMLKRIGFAVHTEKSPRKALTLFRENPHRFDLVITDLAMPEIDGLELTAELKKSSPETPVMLLTGYGKELEQATTLSTYGISRIMKKPVRMGELVSAINEVIKENRQ